MHTCMRACATSSRVLCARIQRALFESPAAAHLPVVEAQVQHRHLLALNRRRGACRRAWHVRGSARGGRAAALERVRAAAFHSRTATSMWQQQAADAPALLRGCKQPAWQPRANNTMPAKCEAALHWVPRPAHSSWWVAACPQSTPAAPPWCCTAASPWRQAPAAWEWHTCGRMTMQRPAQRARQHAAANRVQERVAAAARRWQQCAALAAAAAAVEEAAAAAAPAVAAAHHHVLLVGSVASTLRRSTAPSVSQA